jgi:hypothetical protein
MINPFSRVQSQVAKAQTAAATTNVASAWIDTQGFEGVRFRTGYATGSAADDYVSASMADSSTGENTNTVLGSKVLATTANKNPVLEIVKPAQRYVRLDIVRGVSQAVGDVWADLIQPSVAPGGVGSGITFLALNDPSTGAI